MNEPATDGAPSSVAENIEKIISVESEALRPRSRSEAIADSIGGFVGTISFVGVQIAVTACWAVVNAGMIPVIKPFDPLSVPAAISDNVI